MMGRQSGEQDRLFYDVSLDQLVPADHLVRRIEAVLDLSWLHGELVSYYSHTGRPSVDPELLMRMLIVGYVFAIRSERQLCSEVQVDLAYRWFCGLGLEDPIPDHSVFSRARHERFRDADVFRLVFEKVVGTCLTEGLVDGQSFSVDASFIQADVNQMKRVPGDEPIDWPDAGQASRAVTEYLNALDEDAPEAGLDRGKGGRATKPPKAISLTDPGATWTTKRQKVLPRFVYDANYLIDNKLGIVVDAEGTRANRIDENRACISMVERVKERFGLTPDRLAADTAYGSGKTLKALMECGIEPHVPVIDKSTRNDGTFSRSDFEYDTERDVYTCPGGKLLKTTGNVHSDDTLRYRAMTRDCRSCPLKQRCCPKMPQRRVPRDINEDARDYVRALAKTKAFKISRDERKKVEMAFAHMKRIFKLDRFRLRGLSGVRDEVLLTATAQNLRKLARYVNRSPPNRGEHCFA
jgi:transposase